MTSPMLTPEAIQACEPWRTVWVTDVADGSRGPSSFTVEADEIARAFLAAQDRDALAEIVHEAIDPSREFWWTSDAARSAVDALLGEEKP